MKNMVNRSSMYSKKIYCKKRFKIVSKTRFCIFFASIWLLVYPAILLATDYPKTQHNEKSYIKVYVEKGDTLWDIAEKTLPTKTDIRDYIQEIKAANLLQTANIREGDILNIPINP